MQSFNTIGFRQKKVSNKNRFLNIKVAFKVVLNQKQYLRIHNIKIVS